MRRNSPNPRAALGITVLVLLATSLAPSNITGWMRRARPAVLFVLAPVSGVLSEIGGALRPGRPPAREEDATIDQLASVIDELEARNLVLLAQLRELELLVEQLGRLRVATGVETKTVPATRIASMVGAGSIEVRPGAGAGVAVNAVAIAPGGLQIVGLVTEASPATSTVHLLTDRRFEPSLVVGVVSGADTMIESTAQLARLPRVQLSPTGRGTLVADAVDIAVAERLSVGDTVRVLDETWPRAAQLLVVGRVTRIDDTDEPLFKRVVVEPEVEPSRVRSVLLRMPAQRAVAGEGAG
ncbi:MAG: hypothetical protein Tsb0013_20520 [Phycisphaerales bacterium]